MDILWLDFDLFSELLIPSFSGPSFIHLERTEPYQCGRMFLFYHLSDG